MSIDLLTAFFGWSAIINYTILLIWFLVFTLAHHWIYNMHTMWFEMSMSKFDYTHYVAMALFKLLIFIFNVTPYIVLKFVI